MCPRVSAVAAVLLAAFVSADVQAHRPTQIAAGGDSSCALVEYGMVKCWGSNSNGQLGAGLGMGPMAFTWSPQFVRTEDGEVLRNVRRVVVGSGAASPSVTSHACAITTRNELWCWGTNGHAQLGVQDTVDRTRAVRARYPGGAPLSDVFDVSLGAGFTCVMLPGESPDADMLVQCWGRNDFGQAGAQASDTPVTTPTTVRHNNTGLPLPAPLYIRSGYARTCAVRRGGVVMCWGNAQHGQLGDGDANAVSKSRAVAVLHADGSLFQLGTELSVGGWHGCATRRADGQPRDTLYCWGRNSTGQVGDDSTDAFHARARAVVGAQGDALAYMDALATGNHHACARFGDLYEFNAVYCWGSNSRGQIGRLSPVGTPSRHALEVPPTDDGFVFFSGAKALAAGDAHTCALDTDGRVRCWGRNLRGQLGRYDNDGDAGHPVPYESAIVSTLDGVPVAIFDDGLEASQ